MLESVPAALEHNNFCRGLTKVGPWEWLCLRNCMVTGRVIQESCIKSHNKKVKECHSQFNSPTKPQLWFELNTLLWLLLIRKGWRICQERHWSCGMVLFVESPVSYITIEASCVTWVLDLPIICPPLEECAAFHWKLYSRWSKWWYTKTGPKPWAERCIYTV